MMTGLAIPDAKQKKFLAHPWILTEELMRGDHMTAV